MNALIFGDYCLRSENYGNQDIEDVLHIDLEIEQVFPKLSNISALRNEISNSSIYFYKSLYSD